VLGAHQPARHRRFSHQEGACDLLGRQPVEQAQGQRHLRLGGQGGVAAGEDQAQPFVLHGFTSWAGPGSSLPGASTAI
jgi:hypothetical protein